MNDHFFFALYFVIFLPSFLTQTLFPPQQIPSQASSVPVLEPEDFFGRSVALFEDFDPVTDITSIIVGAPGDDGMGEDRGAVYIISFNSSSIVQISEISDTQGNFPNLSNNDLFGVSVTSLGDLDGDGNTDIAVGSPGFDIGSALLPDIVGAFYVLFLHENRTVRSSPVLHQGDENNMRYGSAISNIGDISGDNITDLAVGDSLRGAIFILFINPDGSIISESEISENQGGFNGFDLDDDSLFGSSIANIGDLNGDDITDIAVGASGQDELFILLLTSSGTVSSAFTTSQATGSNSGDQFGFSVAFLGDLLEDGRSALAVGAPNDDDGPEGAGSMFIIFFGLEDEDLDLNSVQVSATTQAGNAIPFQEDDRFGTSILFVPSSQRLIVGFQPPQSSGFLYVFEIGICGNSVLTAETEECDDGNTIPGDGCDENCRQERGFLCSGSPSDCNPICGDGITVSIETCDDQNRISGDGCSENCTLELGFQCNICGAICGDNILVGGEECDDNNTLSGDGCSALCSLESENNATTAALSMGALSGIVVGVVCLFCILICTVIAVAFCLTARMNRAQVVDLNDLGAVTILSDVKLGEVIGTGAFGEVYKGKWNNIDVALKSTKGQDLQEFQNELKIIFETRHPNILQFFGVYFKSEDNPMIVTEFMNRGDLLHVLHSEADITTKQLVIFCQQISLGMEYLHSLDILHRDLACRNVLVSATKDTEFVIKVADFGLSRQTQDYYKIQSKKIPIRWTAPEVIEFGKASKPSDIWSYGVVVWEIFSRGAIPYAGTTNQQVIKQIKNGTRLTPPIGMPNQVSTIMTQCWEWEVSDRPLFSEISKKMKQIDISKIISANTNLTDSTRIQKAQCEINRLKTILKQHNIPYEEYSESKSQLKREKSIYMEEESLYNNADEQSTKPPETDENLYNNEDL